MKIVTLYRGITVQSNMAKEISDDIMKKGLSGTEGRWKFEIPDIAVVRERIEDLFRKSDLKMDDWFTDTPFRGVCAGGSPSDAAFYALKHNFDKINNQPLVIEFTADINDIYVDCRDFLCSAMKCWDIYSYQNADWQMQILCELFGIGIKRYFDAVSHSKDNKYRIEISNLAAFDINVVDGHLKNDKVISGRHGTIFKSAFFVKAPICPDNIKRIYVPEHTGQQKTFMDLQKFCKGS